jgi:hypothetical protein
VTGGGWGCCWAARPGAAVRHLHVRVGIRRRARRPPPLQALALHDIVTQLRALLVIASEDEPDPAKAYVALSVLTARFADLADNPRAFTGSLQRTIDQHDTDHQAADRLAPVAVDRGVGPVRSRVHHPRRDWPVRSTARSSSSTAGDGPHAEFVIAGRPEHEVAVRDSGAGTSPEPPARAPHHGNRIRLVREALGSFGAWWLTGRLVPGLYFTGLPAAATFGPLMRVCGTWFASPRVAGAVVSQVGQVC